MVTSTNGTPTATIETPAENETATVVTFTPAGKSPKKDKPENKDKGIMSLPDRLHRLNELFDLQRKYNTLQSTLHKLEDFELKRGDEDGSYIVIMDDKRNEFRTSNTGIIKEVVSTIKRATKDKMKEIEPKLTW